MKQVMITKCPICSHDLTVSKLHCDNCNIEISGNFTYNSLLKLNKEQLTFVLVFLKNEGSIKAVERQMNISYPTVKKLLNEVLNALGLKENEFDQPNDKSVYRQEILERFEKKEITFEECKEMLKNLGGN